MPSIYFEYIEGFKNICQNKLIFRAKWKKFHDLQTKIMKSTCRKKNTTTTAYSNNNREVTTNYGRKKGSLRLYSQTSY